MQKPPPTGRGQNSRLHEVAEEQHYVFGYVRNLCDLFLVGTPGVSENAGRRSIREMAPSHFVATKFTLECRRVEAARRTGDRSAEGPRVLRHSGRRDD